MALLLLSKSIGARSGFCGNQSKNKNLGEILPTHFEVT
ncbi:hypothetical protein LEP1GSC161_4090 [Leptospira santarosai str. CBC1416]|uniref:Uncharacterized protein n=1 Tax=Leptospira santarosai str. CBC1416 TaxID=1193059 RepID=M6WA63_9LEPT|nr:hypothetical protein LEP1GSC165_1644 [Leptospira santarosai str. CBC523]EMO58678.1 hypothetical protein LEP1GSC161_4090 [Leptospira santarosai str. CBC1416]